MNESAEDVIYKLKDIRVLINAGSNNYGCRLSGETCKSIVNMIDEMILFVMKMEIGESNFRQEAET